MAQQQFIERKVFYAGTRIFKDGDEGDLAYLIQEGEVEILRRGDDGPERVLAVLGKGELFGEMALIDNHPRMASARARVNTTCVLINRRMFEEKLAKADPFIRGLLNIFVRNIRNLTR